MTAPRLLARRSLLPHLTAAALLLYSLVCNPLPATAAAGNWTALPLPPTRRPPATSDFSIDQAGFPILMAGEEVWRWEKSGWVALSDGARPFTSGVYLSGLYGGPDRGLWMTQGADRGEEGPLYRMSEGRAVRSGSYRFSRSYDFPGIYVSRAGDLFNYTAGSLAVRRGEEWATVDTPLGNKPMEVSIADFSPGGPVVFLARATGDAAIWDGTSLHPKVAVEGLPPDDPGNAMPLAAVRWGKGRLLLWRYSRRPLAAVELREGRLAAVDCSSLRGKLGAETDIYDGWGAPDGSAWLLVHRPGTRAYALVHISPEGGVQFVSEEEMVRLGWNNQRFSQFPSSALALADGTLWLGLEKGGIARVTGGKVEVFSWSRGVSSDGINRLVAVPDGRIFAAGGDGRVYLWNPSAPAPAAVAAAWEEVVDLQPDGPVPAPDGSLWVFRADHPLTVSRWDGEIWRNFEIAFSGRDVRHALADDRGCLLAETERDRVLVCPDGVRRGTEASMQARVAAGARNFAQRDIGTLGPVVDHRGRIWSGRRSSSIRAESEGAVEDFPLVGVSHIGLGDDGITPWFATPHGWWVYREGKLTRVAAREPADLQLREIVARRDDFRTAPQVGENPESTGVLVDKPAKSCGPPARAVNLRALMGPGRDLLPWADDLPRTILGGLVPLIRSRSTAWVPVGWEEARRFEPSEVDDPRLERRAALQYPEGVLCRDAEGPWIADDNITPMRIWRGRPFRADGAGTPFAGRRWDAAGFDPAGRLWVDTGRFGEGRHLYILKVFSLPVSFGAAEVVRGRTITATVAEHAGKFVEYRLDGGPWQEVPGGAVALTANCTSPGSREVALQVRPLDSLGLPHPTIVRSFPVDVRLPVLRWAGVVPTANLLDPVWTPPLAVDWAYPEVAHAVEYRADGGEWRPLERDGSVPAFLWAGRTVTLEFRAIEEGVFASAQGVGVAVSVDVNLKKWARELVAEAGEPRGKGASKAMRYLRRIPEEAVPALREAIAKGDNAAPILQQLLGELEHR